MKAMILKFSFLLAVFPFAVFCQTGEATKSGPTCPKVEVIGPPAVIQPGETGKFRVEIEPVEGMSDLTFSWTADKGSIIRGAETAEITVGDTDELHFETVTVTLLVDGLPEVCVTEFTETLIVLGNVGSPRMADEFGKLTDDNVRVRIDALMIGLQNEPNSIGYLISYGSKTEVLKREKLIKKHIKFRKYSPDRIVFIDGGRAVRFSTRIWILPPDVDLEMIL